jgi:H+/Cl- antiporter ClcA
LVGPFVVVLTLALFGSGIALLFAAIQWRSDLMFLHKATFVLWFGAMTIHVLSHLSDTAKLAPRDWYGRTRREIAGTRSRQWLLVVSVALGILLGMLLAARGASFLSHGVVSG